MKLELDIDTYDQYQEIFISEITEAIRVKLIEAGIDGEQLEHTTGNIAFSISSIIDDMTQIESDGVPIKPYLTFRTGEDELLHCGENACTYEFMRIVLKRMFDV